MRNAVHQLWLPFLLSLVMVMSVSLAGRMLFDAHEKALAEAAVAAQHSMGLVCTE